MIFTALSSIIENVSGIKSLTRVPTGTRILHGFTTAPPEIVSARSMSGMPKRNASLIAHTVPTLLIMHPASAGSFPLGISTPKTADTMNFSEPCGYFVCTRHTDISSP